METVSENIDCATKQFALKQSVTFANKSQMFATEIETVVESAKWKLGFGFWGIFWGGWD